MIPDDPNLWWIAVQTVKTWVEKLLGQWWIVHICWIVFSKQLPHVDWLKKLAGDNNSTC
jgi:hypothetical protein